MMELTARELTIFGFMVVGVALMLISAIGILRLPDLYLRASASSKGATLGVAALLLASALTFAEPAVAGRAVAVIVFMMVTAPVAAHMLGRAAYRSNVEFWSDTVVDAAVQSPDLKRRLAVAAQESHRREAAQ